MPEQASQINTKIGLEIHVPVGSRSRRQRSVFLFRNHLTSFGDFIV